MSSELCSEYEVFRNHMSTDDKPRYFPAGQGVGVVSFDTSQLDSSAQPCRTDDAYENTVSPLHQNVDVGCLQVVPGASQELPNQCWNRGSFSGMYPPRVNMEPFGNHHSYSSPNFGAENEVRKCAHHWRRRLNNGTNVEPPIVQNISFSSSDQRYYHGGYRIHSESYQNCHPYQSCKPQYHAGYHPHPFNSVSPQAQHHTAHSPCNQRLPYHEGIGHETNGAFVRPETEQFYSLRLPYNTTPPHPHYVPSPPHFLRGSYSNPNLEHYHNPSEHFRPENPAVELHVPVSRKRKIEDSSCAQEPKKEYVVYTNRCMSPVSDISVSSATSQDLDDQFLTQFQTPNNNQQMQQTLSVPTIKKQQDVLAPSGNILSNEVSPQNCEHPAFLKIPRIERGEKYYPYFSFDKNAGPVRTVTPMKLPQEGARGNYPSDL